VEVRQGLREKKLIESNLEKVDRLRPIAKELGCSLAQLALAWCVRNEHVSTVITGATKREQVRQTKIQAFACSLACTSRVCWVLSGLTGHADVPSCHYLVNGNGLLIIWT
jgi:hypothetical protein